jgi:hypothetical protein
VVGGVGSVGGCGGGCCGVVVVSDGTVVGGSGVWGVHCGGGWVVCMDVDGVGGGGVACCGGCGVVVGVSIASRGFLLL